MKFQPLNPFKKAYARVKSRLEPLKVLVMPYYRKIETFAAGQVEIARRDRRARVRLTVLVVAAVFMLDYAMYSYHTDKNVLDIFPSIPLLERTQEVTVYLPGLDSKTILVEKRSVPLFDSDENYACYLFKSVEDGSIYDNTSLMVPVEIFIRKVWFNKNGQGKFDCLFDVETPEQHPDTPVIKGSEALFLKALEKTIMKNMPRVNRVYVVENGVPGKPLWETEL